MMRFLGLQSGDVLRRWLGLPRWPYLTEWAGAVAAVAVIWAFFTLISGMTP
jgi:hypothetical protein